MVRFLTMHWIPNYALDSLQPKKLDLAGEPSEMISHLPIPCVGEHGMLRMWIDGCKRSGVKNFMVIAIDDEVRQ